MKHARKQTDEPEQAPRKLRRVLRKPAVVAAVGYSAVQIDFMVADGRFPKPFKLSKGGKAVGWWEDEIISYQEDRAKEADERR